MCGAGGRLELPGKRTRLQSMSSAPRSLISEAEFLRLPETTRPMELVDGELIVAPSPSLWHQEVLIRLVGSLRTWAADAAGSVTVMQSPLDIRFAPGRILQPDAMVFLEVLPRDIPMPIDRIPAICIEVLSTDRAYDRVRKRAIYAEAGVQEYWIVDHAGFVERRTGPGLEQVEELSGRLCSALLPGFELNIAELFA